VEPASNRNVLIGTRGIDNGSGDLPMVSTVPKPQEQESAELSLWVAHPDLAALILGLVLALAICWPLVGGGRVFLLDWVIGPHAAILPPGFYG
jgi:hypothetical protein